MTTTETALTLPIESAQLRALRSADSVVFRLYQGQATIEANRDARNSPDGFDAKSVIYAGGERVSDYTRTGDNDGYAMGNRRNGGRGYAAFHMEHSGPKYSRDLATLISRLAVGNTVKLEWVRGNDSELTREAGIVRDELRLVIVKGKREESYLVESSATLDNSARMVRLA